jgi:hypothetical protein
LRAAVSCRPIMSHARLPMFFRRGGFLAMVWLVNLWTLVTSWIRCRSAFLSGGFASTVRFRKRAGVCNRSVCTTLGLASISTNAAVRLVGASAHRVRS